MRVKEILEMEDMEDLPDNLAKQYTKRAAAERDAGGSVEIDTMLPTISIKLSDGTDYFFQEWEADEMLNKIPGNVDKEDFLLAMAQNW